MGGVSSSTATTAPQELDAPLGSVAVSVRLWEPSSKGPRGDKVRERESPSGSKDPASTSPGLNSALQELPAGTSRFLHLATGGRLTVCSENKATTNGLRESTR